MSTTPSFRYSVTIPPLQGALDFPNWAIKLEDLLTDTGLWEYVFGNQKTAPSDTTLTEDWKAKSRQALSAIRLRVGDTALPYIRSSTTGAEAWQKLQSIYQPKGAITIVLLRRRLARAQCGEDDPIEEFIRQLTEIKDQLVGLGEKVSESEFATSILTALPDSWDNWVSGIEMSSITDSSDIIARILQQNGKQRAKPLSDAIALPARHFQKPHQRHDHRPAKSSFSPSTICFGCGRLGHIKSDCHDLAVGKKFTDEEKQSNFFNSKHSHSSRPEFPDSSNMALDPAIDAIDTDENDIFF